MTLQSGSASFNCFGMTMQRSQNVVFRNCNFDNTTSTFPSNGANFMAGAVIAGIEDNTFINCTTNHTTSISDQTEGFHCSGNFTGGTKHSRNLRLINHTSYNIQQLGNLQLPAPVVVSAVNNATGYQINFTKDVYFENCLAQDIICNGPAAATTSGALAGVPPKCHGFNLGSGRGNATTGIVPENYTLVGCVASRVLSLNGAAAFGFITNGAAGNEAVLSAVFKDCIAEDCQSLIPTLTVNPVTGVPYGNVQNVGVGFLHIPDTSDNISFPATYTDCQALKNQGVPNLATNLGAFYSGGFVCLGSSATILATKQEYCNCLAMSNVYGFLFSNCTSNIVRSCRADVNVSDGTIVQPPLTGEGFTDIGPAGTPTVVGISTSLFEDNRAYNNGPNPRPSSVYFGPNTNYNISVAPGLTVPAPPGTLPFPAITPPILQVQVSSPLTSYIAVNPPLYLANVHNISTIQ